MWISKKAIERQIKEYENRENELGKNELVEEDFRKFYSGYISALEDVINREF